MNGVPPITIKPPVPKLRNFRQQIAPVVKNHCKHNEPAVQDWNGEQKHPVYNVVRHRCKVGRLELLHCKGVCHGHDNVLVRNHPGNHDRHGAPLKTNG
ncbi:hypothetical protein BdWA1_000224 [Babesia duncani]|uniref:Uncharacterized protein n=1 Tax=Babesia duncani TaxID=323732 RepID=A0AAD9PLT5_9APIC|nr:hypothetical protein BdWA1_000224 [Babesia duncani]